MWHIVQWVVGCIWLKTHRAPENLKKCQKTVGLNTWPGPAKRPHKELAWMGLSSLKVLASSQGVNIFPKSPSPFTHICRECGILPKHISISTFQSRNFWKTKYWIFTPASLSLFLLPTRTLLTLSWIIMTVLYKDLIWFYRNVGCLWCDLNCASLHQPNPLHFVLDKYHDLRQAFWFYCPGTGRVNKSNWKG